MKVEYRVRPVTRYHVTRYHQSEAGLACGICTKGEYDNEQAAYDVAYALVKHEHDELGYPLDDERIVYPEPPSLNCQHSRSAKASGVKT